MGLLTGATSLVELILKKYGDDVAGATQELVRLGGFPESVANRIATGELPMDAESVAKRAQDQGYGDVVYRGINGEYDPDKAGYYQMFTTSKQDAAEYGDNVVEARLRLGDNAVIDGGGRNFNSIPTDDGLLVRTDDLAHEAREAGRDSLTIRNIHDKADNEIPKRPAANTTGPSDEEIMRELGLDYSPSPNASPTPDARNYDPVDVDVVFDPSRIRSPNAAFDPEYRGSNIMGGLALPAAAGLLAAGQSEDADAGPILKVISKSQNPMGELRRQVARNKQKGISPETTVQGWIHENTNYDHWGGWATKIDGGMGGETFRNGTDEFISQLIGDMNLDKDTTAGLQAWSNTRLGRELGYKPKWYKQSGNANTSLLGATAAGTGAALTAPLFDFGPTAEDKLAIGLAENARNQQHGTIDAPHRGWVQDATMAARGVQRALQGSPAGLLFPEGTVDYVETINDRQRDPNNWQRASFFLDWAGL